MNDHKIVHLVSLILFAIAELFCIILTIKCFAVERFRREPPFIAIYISFHMLLISTALTRLYDLNVHYSEYLLYVNSFCSVLSKDFIVLIFTNRILSALLNRANKNKVQGILIKIIWILIPLHFIITAVMVIASIEGEIDETILSTYIMIAESIFAILYFYSCWKILPHFRNAEKLGTSEYLRWLLINIIYMIFAIQIRIFNNASMHFKLYEIIKEKSELGLSLFLMGINVSTGLVPPLLLSLCLLKLPKEEMSDEDSLKQSFTHTSSN